MTLPSGPQNGSQNGSQNGPQRGPQRGPPRDPLTLEGLKALGPDGRREWLSAYLDDELSESDARVVGAWTSEDPDMLREVERLRRLDDLLGHYPDEPVPEGFAGRVFQAVGVSSRSVSSEASSSVPSNVSPSVSPSERGGGRVIQMAWYRNPGVLAAGLVSMAAAMLLAFGLALRDPAPPKPVDNVPASTGAVAAIESLPDEVFADIDAFERLVDLEDDAVDAALVGGFDDLELLGG